LLKKQNLLSIKQLQLQKRGVLNKPVKLQAPEKTRATEELVGNRGKTPKSFAATVRQASRQA
jgi:hypothetical protein